ncbi:DUF6663 family protein [Halobaculum magnesiiphilum]|uniref:Uncharacterized protein n=1 Tax=Halobaculum magnesiiphilum TaxID=1017351 RepID=A0A8T8WBK0_9EURY|nr:DUF6663 family protein [Halobaculum magnesiiphilum]QZP37205.1 hypothetical protein K6T50_13070 [Halobaculum magnesiiphilum]
MDEPDDEPDAVDPWAGDGDDDWVETADGATTDPDGTAADAGSADAAGAEDVADGSTGAGSDPAASTDADGLGPRRYRVLDRADGSLVFVDLDTPEPGPGPEPDEGFEPVRVAADSDAADRDDESVADAVAELEPGYVVTATLRWPDSTAGGDGAADGDSPLARVESLTVERESRYRFIDDAEPMFEAARDAWRDANAAGDGMGSRVTRDTDGEPNGALYVFGEAGARDLFGEFRSGTTPLEPLVERVNDDLDDDPREVFVLRPPDGAFVAVYIAFEKDGLLARTVRDTYL